MKRNNEELQLVLAAHILLNKANLLAETEIAEKLSTYHREYAGATREKIDVSDLFSTQVKYTRDTLGISQMALANTIGVSKLTMTLWEGNKVKPGNDHKADNPQRVVALNNCYATAQALLSCAAFRKKTAKERQALVLAKLFDGKSILDLAAESANGKITKAAAIIAVISEFGPDAIGAAAATNALEKASVDLVFARQKATLDHTSITSSADVFDVHVGTLYKAIGVSRQAGTLWKQGVTEPAKDSAVVVANLAKAAQFAVDNAIEPAWMHIRLEGEQSVAENLEKSIVPWRNLLALKLLSKEIKQVQAVANEP